MRAPTRDDPIAALRDEIRRAGQNARRWRCLATAAGLVLLLGRLVWVARPHLGLVMLAALPGVPSRCLATGPTWVVTFEDWHWPLAIAGGVVLMLAYVLWRNYPLLRRAGLRSQAGSLSAAQRDALFLQLRNERCRETRRIVAPLLREFGNATELTPAFPPEGRGDEASPAGRAP